MSNNAHELSNRLLNALDNNYNVVDMHAVNEIISILERINITKELLETTRLGKHVNELRRKTTDQTLARRAKVLVKRWRDLVIPSVTSPGHPGSNRSSAERAVRRLGGTPLTSPALSRQVVSPAVPSPRPPSRPAWGGYESDSQDVILVDDDPPPAVKPPPDPLTAVKRPPSTTPPHDEKKAKRDKKPKKKRGYSRAGSGAEAAAGADPVPAPLPAGPPATAAPAPHPDPAAGSPWPVRNGAGERRRNGFRRDNRKIDPYTALVNKMPPAGAKKKVKTTQELLEEIQQRAGKPASPPRSPDVMLIEPEPVPVKVDSPLRNGSSSLEPRVPSPLPMPEPEPEPEPEPWQPLEDYREYRECTCGEEEEDEHCAAKEARLHSLVLPVHVRALHHTFLPGINGTRAPALPHKFAVRKIEDPDKPGLFNSVVPLYKYSDYADDYCTKNMDSVPLCSHLPWTEFAPPPPDPPPPPSPPPIRPYPIEEPEVEEKKEKEEVTDTLEEVNRLTGKVEAEMVGLPRLEPSERLKAPILMPEDETQFGANEKLVKMEVEKEFSCSSPEHRTVERTKAESGGRALYEQCMLAREAVPYDYEQFSTAPTVTLPEDPSEAEASVSTALAEAEADSSRDELSRPLRATRFAEWHECAVLGPLVALPYVVID